MSCCMSSSRDQMKRAEGFCITQKSTDQPHAIPRAYRSLCCAMLLCVIATLGAHADDHKNPNKHESSSTSTSTAGSDPVLVGAGDIASCDDLAGAYATAKLIENIPGTVLAVGDLAYPDGSDENFSKCYAPTLGAFQRPQHASGAWKPRVPQQRSIRIRPVLWSSCWGSHQSLLQLRPGGMAHCCAE